MSNTATENLKEQIDNFNKIATQNDSSYREEFANTQQHDHLKKLKEQQPLRSQTLKQSEKSDTSPKEKADKF